MTPTGPTAGPSVGPAASVIRRSSGRAVRRLAVQYVEMVAAMMAGMLAFGALRGVAGLTVSFDAHPGTSYLLMATDMALGMALWMRVRRHGWGHTLQMSAAMYVPVVLLPVVWIDAMAPMAFMVAAHVLMMVAMLVVLVRHRTHVA